MVSRIEISLSSIRSAESIRIDYFQFYYWPHWIDNILRISIKYRGTRSMYAVVPVP